MNKTCKYKNNAAYAMKKLKEMTYGNGPNDDYNWDIMTQHEHVDIVFSCPHFISEAKVRGGK
jgi:hypothetical protein